MNSKLSEKQKQLLIIWYNFMKCRYVINIAKNSFNIFIGRSVSLYNSFSILFLENRLTKIIIHFRFNVEVFIIINHNWLLCTETENIGRYDSLFDYVFFLFFFVNYYLILNVSLKLELWLLMSLDYKYEKNI